MKIIIKACMNIGDLIIQMMNGEEDNIHFKRKEKIIKINQVCKDLKMVGSD
jgi:hypothetical protein